MVLSWAEVKRREKYPYIVPPDCPYMPVVDEDKCNLCGMCEACVHGVFKIEEKKLLIDKRKCDNCGFCLTLCPKEALILVDKQDTTRVIWDVKDAMAEPYRRMLEEMH